MPIMSPAQLLASLRKLKGTPVDKVDKATTDSSLGLSSVQEAQLSSAAALNTLLTNLTATGKQLNAAAVGELPQLAGIRYDDDDAFEIAVIPDPQYLTASYSADWRALCSWIAARETAHADGVHVLATLTTGDLSDANLEAEFTEAEVGFATIKAAGVPVYPMVGNHDGNFANYDAAFPYAYITSQSPDSSGQYTAEVAGGTAHSYYVTRTFGSQQFLFLILGVPSGAAQINWAKTIVAANLDKKVIVLQHNILACDGRFDTTNAAADDDVATISGEYLWTNLLSQYPNIIMAIGGHHIARTRVPYCPYFTNRVDAGVYGNIVHTIFANYQDLDVVGSRAAAVVILKFDPASGTITATPWKTYSTPAIDTARGPVTLFYNNPVVQSDLGSLSRIAATTGSFSSIEGQGGSNLGLNTVTNGKVQIGPRFRMYCGPTDGVTTYADLRITNYGGADENFGFSAKGGGAVVLNADHGTGGLKVYNGAAVVSHLFDVGRQILYGSTGTGGFTTKSVEAVSAALSGASGAIAVNVPSGARILGVQLRVDTAITSDNATKTWSAAYANTPTTAICSGKAFDKNTKYDAIHPAYEITTGTVTITISAAAGSFTAGVVRAIVYYESLTAMGNA